MAAVAPTSDPILNSLGNLEDADLLQKMTLDSETKTLEISDPTRKYAPVNFSNVPNGAAKPFERSMTPLSMDASACYFPNSYQSIPYSYGAYDGQGNEWHDCSRFLNHDGFEMSIGVYSDGLYHHGYGYTPYGAYPLPGSPAQTMGNDGQLYGPQHYQYPNAYYQSSTPTPTNGTYSSNQRDISTSAAAEQIPLSVETVKGNFISNGGNLSVNNGSKVDVRLSQLPWLDAPKYSGGQSKRASNGGISVSHTNNLSYKLPHARPTFGLGQVSGYMDGMYLNKMYSYRDTYKGGPGFGSFGYESRSNGRGWLAVENNYKPHRCGSFGYGNYNMDGLNELNRGPRAKGFKNQKGFGPVTLAVKGQNILLSKNEKDDGLPPIPDEDLYNKEFPDKFPNAKFFVIKSYSEDDVHKSIKYGAWASTTNGNKKLDAAYRESKEKAGDCPVFLLFSVNTSGQFVGLAEMVGAVDFEKTVEYWQQDKWNGCFPVKWHILKDIPNSLLKHIILENNDNKPVTNSRDSQEVKLEQGIQILKIFKEHSSRTCIVDDFLFYEARQKAMQEKKSRQQQQFQKQVSDGKGNDGSERDDAAAFGKEKLLSSEMKQVEENGLAAVVAENVSEKELLSNGVN